MSAEEINIETLSDFSIEEMRRIEIRQRLEALRIAKPIIEEFHLIARDNIQKIIGEILSLEEELDAITQGQLILD